MLVPRVNPFVEILFWDAKTERLAITGNRI